MFGEHLVTVPCGRAEVPSDADAPVPKGYVRIEGATGFEPADSAAGSLPVIRDGCSMLVSNEHVAMIQGEE
jgi:hypothetical protein